MTWPNPDLTVFRDIISIDEIEDQVLATLATWMPTYTAAICRQKNMGRIPPNIRSYVRLEKFRHKPENQTPAIVLVNPGTTQTPQKNGEGWYRATFLLGISAITSVREHEQSMKISKIHQAAVRAILLQKRAGGGLVSDVAWNGENYDTVDVGAPEMMAAATGTFEIIVDGLVKKNGAGPLAPILTDPDPLPVVVDSPGRITVKEKED